MESSLSLDPLTLDQLNHIEANLDLQEMYLWYEFGNPMSKL